MKTILEDFSHEKGLHCDTSSLRDVFAYAGHGFPEPFFFGIGEGLGFFFRDGRSGKPPVASGRTGVLEIERRACRLLGCDLKISTSSSPRRARETLASMLANGQPVMLHADQYYLKYLRSPSHFGAYSLVVAGIDEEAGIAHVADHMRENLIEVPLAELAEARASIHRPFPARHRWFRFGIPSDIKADSKQIMAAIGRNTMEMLNAPVRNCGVGGIYYLANCMYRWEEKYSKKELDDACRIVHDAIAGPGTGGSCFRCLYADFLQYAAENFDLPGIAETADGYRRVGNMWAQAGKVLAEVRCGCSALTEAADIIQIIAAREHELQVSLMAAANLCCRRR
ncbi:BtrH N-terminal domain-containing protein [Methanocella arvoryzae]|uniref:DUF4872 domain-containing protein n=1 Tax=Methanocella arvoryzae (strain DSM 22066 / NBRC 105507 / MRE50) TaxID=351160 RepID=Q0W7D7_METAR|nr:BtrH N-terminal domain-containing protein [Methanocella arvoryzae]CAJ35706.1 conserved hypothetical protein [Methanocella arvoryzae MRE50]